MDHLAQAKDWLAERVKSCEQTEGAARGGACADSVLTVRALLLPLLLLQLLLLLLLLLGSC